MRRVARVPSPPVSVQETAALNGVVATSTQGNAQSTSNKEKQFPPMTASDVDAVDSAPRSGSGPRSAGSRARRTASRMGASLRRARVNNSSAPRQQSSSTSTAQKVPPLQTANSAPFPTHCYSPPLTPRDATTSSATAPAECQRESVSLSTLRTASTGGVRAAARSAAADACAGGTPSSYGLPNHDDYHDLFPPALAAQATLVPALLNLPLLNLPRPNLALPHLREWGVVASGALIGIALHFTAREGECEYTATQSHLFALRHGAGKRALAGEPPLTNAEFAVIAVARRLGAGEVPDRADRDRVFACLGAGEVEWIVLACALMSFLNTVAHATAAGIEGCEERASVVRLRTSFMSALGEGMDEEQSRSSSRGGGGGGAARLRALDTSDRKKSMHNAKKSSSILSPSRVAVDVRHSAGVPGSWPRIGRYLTRKTGHEFAIFRSLRHARAARAIGSMLVRCADGAGCEISLRMKCLASVVYGCVNGNWRIVEEFKKIARIQGLSDVHFDAVEAFTQESHVKYSDIQDIRSCLEYVNMNAQQRAVLMLAKACAQNPPAYTSQTLDVVAAHLHPRHMVEVVTWIAIMNILHRLYLFYLPTDELR